MTIGLTPYQTEAPTRFGWSLWLPFRKPAATAPTTPRVPAGHARRKTQRRTA